MSSINKCIFRTFIFGSPYEQDINKYSIYVHLQDDWKSHPRNILFDVTNVWSNQHSSDDLTSYSIDPTDLSTLSNYNSNQLQEQHGKLFVELSSSIKTAKSYEVDS